MGIGDEVTVVKMHLFKSNEKLQGIIKNISTKETSDMFGDDGIEKTFYIDIKNKIIKITYDNLGNMIGSYPYKIKDYRI